MSPSANFLLELLLAASLLGNLVLLGIRIFGRGERAQIAPQPLKVQAEAEYVLRHDFERCIEEATRRQTEVEHALTRAAELAADSRKAMYAKMDAMRTELSGEISRVHSRVDDLQAEVRAVPSTVVRLITEARQI